MSVPTKPNLSPARLAANRANAEKSSGPRTEAGKARSRANAVKHGLTGAGVALPDEDAAAVEGLFLEFQEQMAPATRVGAELVHDVALMTVRKHRARSAQAAWLRARVRRAGGDFDRARAGQADRLLDAIETHPRPYRRELLTMAEGVDRLIGALEELLADLTGEAPYWSQAHHQRLDALFGYRPADLPRNRPTRFSKAVLGDLAAIGDAALAAIPEDVPTPAWAAERLVEVIGAEIARLQAHRLTLDHASIAADRLDAIKAARFDPSREAQLAHRYELAATRELSRALRDLPRAEALGAPEPPEPPDDPEPAEPPPGAPEDAPDPATEIEAKLIPGNDLHFGLGSFGAIPAAGDRSAEAGPVGPVVPPLRC